MYFIQDGPQMAIFDILQGGLKKVDFCDFLRPENYFSKGNLMWGIDCAHSRILKMLS